MGGAPMLLLLAAMGITYGWQPDGNGGVEYVIQIPQEQLEELKRSGKFTSVIDPKMQGHVSRVIVKLGSETLREITPAELNQIARAPSASDVGIAPGDRSPVPIPEMRQVVMKPADGFDLPPTLDNAASGPTSGSQAGANSYAAQWESQAREAAAATAAKLRASGNSLNNQAGNALGNATATTFGGGASNAPPTNAPPSIGYPNTANATQPPNFTGADPTGATSRSRQGGPSTEPADQRDRDWFVNGRSRVPSTEPVGYGQNDPRALAGPPDLRTTAGNTASSTSAAASNGQAGPQSNTGGYGTTNTFGSVPADLRTNTAAPRYASTGYDSRAAEAPNYGSSFGSQNGNALPTANSQADVDPRLTQAEIAKLPKGAWSINGFGQPIDRQGRVLDPWGRPVGASAPVANTPTDSRGAVGNAAPNTRGQTANAQRDPRDPAANTPPNPRVAATNTPPGTRLNPPTQYDYARSAPSTEAVTLPLPNRGNPVPSYSGQYDTTQHQHAHPPSSYPDPRATLSTNSGNYYPPPAATPRPATPTLQAPQTPSHRIEQPAQTTPVFDRSAGFANERPPNHANVAPGTAKLNRTESHGPLFNTLLLVSAVGNIYLFFWLKNLRFRFRDLVAAKRIATSNIPST